METTITLNDLLTLKKYRRMSIKKLAHIINHRIDLEDYAKLEGAGSDHKAVILWKNWRNK